MFLTKIDTPYYGDSDYGDGDYSDKRSGAPDHSYYGDGSCGDPAHIPLDG